LYIAIERPVMETPKRKSIASLPSRIAQLDTRIGSSPAVDRIRGREHNRIRERIIVRDGGACVRCGCGINLEVDHIIPLYAGGAESDANRQTLCKICHAKKSEAEENQRKNL
jgi:5-methylcytosine-specific restriction endonuclease McrA